MVGAEKTDLVGDQCGEEPGSLSMFSGFPEAPRVPVTTQQGRQVVGAEHRA